MRVETPLVISEIDTNVATLLDNGVKRKWIAYEEINNTLPDHMVDPEWIDLLLVTTDRLGIDLIDLRDFSVRDRKERKKSKNDSPPPPPAPAPAQVAEANGAAAAIERAKTPEELEAESLDDEEAKRAIAEALAESSAKRIDDPVRMYLTQMGTIPLLTRDEEIRLAKKLETTRMIFRRRCLENDRAVELAVETLEKVKSGEAPFDRTMRISTAEENAKDKIARRIPYNLETVRKLLEIGR
ncbi:MAG: sigma-70 factor domain-containing protein, partial [Planctomycetota bacterium]|nr:sigma-70 factor domain-containing protein [Planctomycetota bacterium]